MKSYPTLDAAILAAPAKPAGIVCAVGEEVYRIWRDGRTLRLGVVACTPEPPDTSGLPAPRMIALPPRATRRVEHTRISVPTARGRRNRPHTGAGWA